MKVNKLLSVVEQSQFKEVVSHLEKLGVEVGNHHSDLIETYVKAVTLTRRINFELMTMDNADFTVTESNGRMTQNPLLITLNENNKLICKLSEQLYLSPASREKLTRSNARYSPETYQRGEGLKVLYNR